MNLRGFLAIVNKELRALTQERTILIAFAIQLFIASFSSALLSGLISVYDPDAIQLSERLRPRVGVVGARDHPIIGFLDAHHARVSVFNELGRAADARRAGQLDTVIAVTAEDTLELYLPASETQAKLLKIVLRRPLKQYEQLLRRRNGIRMRYQDIKGEPSTSFEFRYGILVPMLMFFPAFVAGGIVIDTVSQEFTDRTLETLWSAPLSLNAILLAKSAATLLVTAVQCVLWLGLLSLNGVRIGNWGGVLAIALIGSSLIAIIATLIALSFQDRERSQFVYALFIVSATSLSTFLPQSPLALVSRLSVGDPTSGWVQIVSYVGLLMIALTVLLNVSKPLITRSDT
jgi:ABC-2 type transport system permease protein